MAHGPFVNDYQLMCVHVIYLGYDIANVIIGLFTDVLLSYFQYHFLEAVVHFLPFFGLLKVIVFPSNAEI